MNCWSCNKETDSLLDPFNGYVCTECFREPTTNNCTECGLHLEGICYEYVCGVCLKKPGN